ncbi:MAG: sterol desaturase family protein [Reyranella sp.]|nr:sterol desaturase family protein [Reyranella sp.]
MTAKQVASETGRHGRLESTAGTLAGALALALAVLIVAVVSALRFSDGQFGALLGRSVDIGVLREVLFFGMAIAGGLAVANLVQSRGRWLNGATVALILVAVALGGHRVPIADLPAGTPYLGLDRFALNLLGSSLIFIAIEKLSPLRAQAVLRPEWRTDSTYLIVNHLLAGLVLILASFALHDLLGWMVWPPLQTWVGSLPFFAQLLLALLVTDIIQYWTHRAFHEIPFLWRFHAVHHSIEHMDWIAGFRMHLFELTLTRVLFLCALLLMGFDKAAMGAYVVVVGLQTVFNHANLRLPAVFGRAPLKWLIVTPDFHHWHHTVEPAAIDHNYASHFSFLDYLFGTAVKPDRFPDEYGVIGRYVPPGFVRQQLFPFFRKR